MLGNILGVVVLVLLADALFFEGKLRKWAWGRIRNSEKDAD